MPRSNVSSDGPGQPSRRARVDHRQLQCQALEGYPGAWQHPTPSQSCLQFGRRLRTPSAIVLVAAASIAEPPPRHARRGRLTAFLHGRSEGHPSGRGILSARMQRVPWCHGRRRTRTESGLGSRSQEGLGREIVLRAQERYSRKRSASVSALGRKAHGRDRPRHDDEFRSPDVGRATTTRPRRPKQLSAPTAPPCGGRRFHQSIRYRHQRFPTRRFRCKAP